jgi:hypothetical protein
MVKKQACKNRFANIVRKVSTCENFRKFSITTPSPLVQFVKVCVEVSGDMFKAVIFSGFSVRVGDRASRGGCSPLEVCGYS